MTLNPASDVNRLLTVTLNDSITIQKTDICFGVFCFSSQGTFSYETPHLMKLSTVYYKKLVEMINEIICINPKNCERDADIYTSFSAKEKLTITFTGETSSIESESFTITFKIKQLYFISASGRIEYNFASYVPLPDSKNIIIFGLLYLKYCNVILAYNIYHKKYELLLSAKESDLEKRITQLFVVASVIMAAAVTVWLMRVSPSYQKELGLFLSNSFLSSSCNLKLERFMLISMSTFVQNE